MVTILLQSGYLLKERWKKPSAMVGPRFKLFSLLVRLMVLVAPISSHIFEYLITCFGRVSILRNRALQFDRNNWNVAVWRFRSLQSVELHLKLHTKLCTCSLRVEQRDKHLLIQFTLFVAQPFIRPACYTF